MPSYEVDRQKWAQLSICEQMGNAGAEVGRAISASRAGNEKRAAGAVDRALDLIDATVEALLAQGPQSSPRVKEVLRARDEFSRLFFDGTFETDADAIERYFNQFAFAARMGV